MPFNPREHPRNPHGGKFIDKGDHAGLHAMVKGVESAAMARGENPIRAVAKALAAGRANGTIKVTPPAEEGGQAFAGGEHYVRKSHGGARMSKDTIDGQFGFEVALSRNGKFTLEPGRASKLVERVEEQNQAHGTDTRFEGSHDIHSGGLTFSQRNFPGPHPSEVEAHDYMTDHGYSRVPGYELEDGISHVYFHRGTHRLAVDANRKNFKQTPTGPVPVDLIISHEPPGSPLHEAAMRVSELSAVRLGPGLQRGTEQLRGERAMRQVLERRIDVPGAMHHAELGAIDFRHGHAGAPARNYADGHGIAQVAAQHGWHVAMRLPHVIAYGKVHYGPNSVHLEHAGHRVVLISKHPDGRHGSHWLSYSRPSHTHR